MSVITDFTSQISSSAGSLFQQFKQRVLGENNERLDFIMDSFYKLSPQQQTGAILGSFSVVGLVVLGAILFYFSRINNLESQLNQGFDSLHRLRVLSAQYKRVDESMRYLKKSVNRKTSKLRPKAFFEKIAGQVGVTLQSLRSEEKEITDGSPLAANFKYLKISFRMPKVSLPRMLKFFSEIERSDKTLIVSNLTIRGLYGSKKLYFDVEADVTGFKVGSD